MPRSLRLFPLLALALAAGAGLAPSAPAQTPSARYAFADTTLLRDTLDIDFRSLFSLADSLRVRPDSLRAFAIRWSLGLERLAFLSDSLGMPVDSVGPLLERERFNPLAPRRASRSSLFSYGSTYSVNRQTSSWGNTVNYDFRNGPLVLHNVTSVLTNRTAEIGTTTLYRNNASTTEAGFRLTPDLSVGTRLTLQETENFRLGTARTTTNNQVQGSVRSRAQIGPDLHGELNLFGGPFRQPRNSLTSAAKEGFGTEADGRLQYQREGLASIDVNGSADLKLGSASIQQRATYSTQDLKWAANGTADLFPSWPTGLLVNARLSGDRIERPVSFKRITPIEGSSPPANDTAVVDRLVEEPSGVGSIQASTRIPGGRFGSVTVTGTLGRTTRLLATERKEGLVFDQTVTRDHGVTADGTFSLAGWSLAAQFSIADPSEDNPRRSAVSVVQPDGSSEPVNVAYRERSITRNRSVSAQLTRALSQSLTFKARGDVGLVTYRYDVTDSSYLALTQGTHVEVGDPHDDYRQSYRLETTLAPPTDFSTTLALEVSRVLTVYLESNRSGTNLEDRVYRAEWLWTYRLLPGLTANQRNQIDATYSRYVYTPQIDRLTFNYSTITTLNASVTRRLAIDLTHTSTYGPSGSYLRADDGLDYFVVSNASRDYSLSGRIAWSPSSMMSISVMPYYLATYREDRSSGLAVPTVTQKRLSLAGAASLNLPVGDRGRLSGTITRTLDSRRDTRYSAGAAQLQPRSEIDYWNGSLQFSWSL